MNNHRKPRNNMDHPLMKCGHSASGYDTRTKAPVCTSCIGIITGADVVAEQPKLAGRQAQCAYGAHAIVASSTSLDFFEYRPDKPMDQYYCGCHGWD